MHGWKKAFEHQTGIPATEVTKWSAAGRVPIEGVEATKTLKPVSVKPNPPPAPKRAQGENTIAARAKAMIEAAMPDGLDPGKLDGNMTRRVKEMVQRGEVVRKGNLLVIANIDTQKKLSEKERTILLNIHERDGLTTNGVETAMPGQTSVQERIRDLERLHYLERRPESTRVYHVTPKGKRILGVA
jgi:hypothetical protein